MEQEASETPEEMLARQERLDSIQTARDERESTATDVEPEVKQPFFKRIFNFKGKKKKQEELTEDDEAAGAALPPDDEGEGEPVEEKKKKEKKPKEKKEKSGKGLKFWKKGDEEPGSEEDPGN